jgi:hypothetical protein
VLTVIEQIDPAQFIAVESIGHIIDQYRGASASLGHEFDARIGRQLDIELIIGFFTTL